MQFLLKYYEESGTQVIIAESYSFGIGQIEI
jgi:hypothetical protein